MKKSIPHTIHKLIQKHVMCVTNNLRTATKLKDTSLLMHVMKPNLSVIFVSMVVRMKKGWMYTLEGITLINLNVVYVNLRQAVKKS